MTPVTIELFVTVVGTVLASSGFWMFFLKRTESNDLKSKLLLGLAHDRIMSLGLTYIERGNITSDEYENLCQYLYKPYEEMGGNGSAKRIMMEVDKLPILKSK